jgi:preprotein translocase subunit SecF
MNIPFVAQRKYFYLVSAVFVVLAFVSLLVYGLKPGIDFTGGSSVELEFTDTRPLLVEMQAALPSEVYGAAMVQPIGEQGYLLRLRFITEEEHQELLSRVRTTFETEATSSTPGNRVLEKSIETIGPTISASLKERSLQAVFAVVLAIGLYIAYTFRKVSRPVESWKYGAAAIVALVHDVIITLGVFALLGRFASVEIGIPFVVALLTILGYSINDTIVVFDRIRENLARYGSNDFVSLVNRAFNETFIRSINTSVTVLIVLTSMFIFGGESIRDFVLALIIGVFVGTYSSIFIASALLVTWHEWSEKKKKTA